MIRYLLLISTAVAIAAASIAAELPRVIDPGWQIELIAAEPDLVTPTGCCFDDQNRLLVIECHTHFAPDGYEGPTTDRIYIFDDSDNDGVLDRKRLFHEGGTATMNLANLGDGWIGVSTRSEIIRLRDSDGDDVADQREVLLTHKTKANYPHNGLGGLTYSPDGWLYLGQGENFGETYELVGTDGAIQVGGGEGGNVFRCRADGSELQRVATGFWNPFGMCIDQASRLWAVGNDPDAMPPNRLMRIVPTADFGFQFRFGRAGIHPLQSWNGEFPGTLPMTAGTGEAACCVIAHDGFLWVTSWGDNRIERYSLEPDGATWSSKTEVVVQGDANFRPVGLAYAGDGSIYVTDWVSRSYPVHGKGRLWRISRQGENIQKSGSLPPLSDAEIEATKLRDTDELAADDRLTALRSDDAFLRQAAIAGLIQSGQLAAIDRSTLTDPKQRVSFLAAWRWRELSDPKSVNGDQRLDLVRWGMRDDAETVVMAALRWATERNCEDELPAIREMLNTDGLTTRLFAAIIASIAYLESGSASGKKRDPAIEKLLVDFAKNSNHADRLRGLAVQRIPVESSVPADEELRAWVTAGVDRSLTQEVIRLLSARASDAATDQLASIAADETVDLQSRADALAGLSEKAGLYASLITKLSLPRQSDVLRKEAQRIQNRKLQTSNASHPSVDDVSAWNELIGSGGDVDAGRRVFFRRTCVNCHVHSGRGATTGPNLTTLAGQMTRQRVLESILHPSKEVGPLYVPWLVQTTDGRLLNGLKIDAAGVSNRLRFQGADGNVFEVALEDIEVQKAAEQSIMPAGLQQSMTVDELRDLIAFLVDAPK